MHATIYTEIRDQVHETSYIPNKYTSTGKDVSREYRRVSSEVLSWIKAVRFNTYVVFSPYTRVISLGMKRKNSGATFSAENHLINN